MSARLWVDGEIRPAGAEVYHASDRGATLGDGVFDTALCAGGKVVWGAAHLARLWEAAEAFGHGCTREALAAAYDLAREADGPSVLRVAVSRGPGARGLGHDPAQRARIVAQLSPLPPALPFAPVDLDVSEIARNQTSPQSRHKTAGYLDAIVAMRRAAGRGAGDALFLNCAGQVACTTMANVFALSGHRLTTPPLADGVLAGITRARVLALAPALGLEPVEASLGLDDLRAAQEVFATNSLRLVVPVRNFGGSSLTLRAALARALCADIAAQTGLALPLPDWAA